MTPTGPGMQGLADPAAHPGDLLRVFSKLNRHEVRTVRHAAPACLHANSADTGKG